MRNYLDLTGKVALITGASSGIGAAAASVFADLGARVAFTYHQNEKGAEKVRGELEKSGAKPVAIKADVRRSEDIQSMIDRTVKELGPMDILVNNAGSLVERQRIAQITDERWDEILNLNLTSVMECCRIVAPQMVERKSGSIVNIVSIAGRNGGGPGALAYSTAKGALITFTKGLARELAPQGVRVNAVSPGVIDTPFHEVFSTPEMIRNFVTSIPMGRTGTSMECATAIAFLASNAASYITGETVEVNGGQLML
ncbi:MAG TPA: 3-oxoacyl-ACP reductase FabG [Bryobacteraceae bacterium]|nr:3-oxoacyl-ACP reductase FabG [Bryobacteraceae bacterium]